MIPEVPRLAEVLQDRERFETFARGMLARGWVSDEELHISRAVIVELPTPNELESLCERFGSRDLVDLHYNSVAFRHDGGFVYYLYDMKRFDSAPDLVADLKYHGIEVQWR
ncbi:hypothetical protein ACTJLC_07765 [Paraburkholderia sp. 22099]|uniref:hypothetical protein n=1 Tax=Paraburkholderia sp. 22099 TaxID=3453875 RepID=UPI003F868613